MGYRSTSLFVHFEVLKFFLFPVLILALLLGWVDNGYPGISKHKIYGAPYFADARCTKDVDWCASSFLEIQASEKILVGDSEAMSMIDSFRVSGLKNGFSTAIRARSGCSFMFDNHNGGQDRNCRNFVLDTTKYLRNVTAKKIYIYNRINNFSVSDYLDFFESFAKNGNEIVIIGNPLPLKNGFSAYTNILRDVPMGTPRQFFQHDFDSTYLKTQVRIRNSISASTSTGIKFLSTFQMFCPAYPCTLRNDSGEWYYSDSTHLSRFGTDFLLRNLERSHLI